LEGVTVWAGGGVKLGVGVEIFCCSFTCEGGFGVGKFDGLVCGAGVAAVTGFCASFGVTALPGVPGARGVFCPAGWLTVGLGVGPPVACCRCDSGGAGVVEGFGAIRFGGVPFDGTIRAGRFPLDGCLSTGEPVAPGWGGPPGVPRGFTVGEALPKDFVPSRLGGTGLFPSVAAFGEPTGVLGFGDRAPGFTKLGVFCPAAGVGAPIVSFGDPIGRPLLPICGFTKGVGFG
jgi:hypothetical protein